MTVLEGEGANAVALTAVNEKTIPESFMVAVSRLTVYYCNELMVVIDAWIVVSPLVSASVSVRRR